MSRFIGRKSELEQLNQLVTKKSSSLVVIRGRRRIGKSRLVEEFGRHHRFISLSGLPPRAGVTAQDERDEIMAQLSRKYSIPRVKANRWGDVFWLLARTTQAGRAIVFLDEISWMGSKDPDFLGQLKIAWDQDFSKNPELILVLCGSISSWIEENILSHTGFFGRISLDMTVRELPLPDCRRFWPDRISAFEILKILAVTGGVPKYLEDVRPEKSAENNIASLCFRKEGLLFREFDAIFHDLFEKRSEHYKAIVQTLAAGPQTLDAICKKLEIEKGGVISKHLRNLELAGFIQITPTWNLKERIPSRLKRYRLSDNYTRFYLKYILPKYEQIKQGTFQIQGVDALSGWSTILGLQFESLILANQSLLFSQLDIAPETVLHSGPFFQQVTKEKQGCQIDLLIQTKHKTLYLCEIKFSQSPIGMSVVKEVQQKIEKISIPRLFSIRPVLIHVNGVTDEVRESELFDAVIDFHSLLD